MRATVENIRDLKWKPGPMGGASDFELAVLLDTCRRMRVEIERAEADIRAEIARRTEQP